MERISSTFNVEIQRHYIIATCLLNDNDDLKCNLQNSNAACFQRFQVSLNILQHARRVVLAIKQHATCLMFRYPLFGTPRQGDIDKLTQLSKQVQRLTIPRASLTQAHLISNFRVSQLKIPYIVDLRDDPRYRFP